MAHIKIDKDKCKDCGLCVLYCPNKLLAISEDLNKKGIHTAEFKDNNGRCTGCTMCAIICPDCAIEVYK